MAGGGVQGVTKVITTNHLDPLPPPLQGNVVSGGTAHPLAKPQNGVMGDYTSTFRSRTVAKITSNAYNHAIPFVNELVATRFV